MVRACEVPWPHWSVHWVNFALGETLFGRINTSTWSSPSSIAPISTTHLCHLGRGHTGYQYELLLMPRIVLSIDWVGRAGGRRGRLAGGGCRYSGDGVGRRSYCGHVASPGQGSATCDVR